jgi:cytoskeletal protein CcmA (bactofilin family)
MKLFGSGRRGSDRDLPVSVLGTGIEVTGSIRATGAVRIDGVVHGDVTGGDEIVVGALAEIHGNIAAERVLVAGHLHGHLVAPGAVLLAASAVMDGDVRTPRLTIEDGAVLNGHLAMAAPAAVPAVAPAATPVLVLAAQGA